MRCVRRIARRRRWLARIAGLAAAVGCSAGCMMGPDYRAASAPLAGHWLEADDNRVQSEASEIARWWEVFNDPVLARLVEIALQQNPTLEAAGLRVVEAQARRGIAIGGLYPQTQALQTGYTHNVRSLNATTAVTPAGVGTTGATAGIGSAAGAGRGFDNWGLDFTTAWEIDLWGRFRRGIEAADADLLGALASYDDVLVSLVGQAAAAYVQVRVFEERLAIARDNARAQQDGLDIARVRFEAGGTSDLDVQQALTLLRDTEATIPQLDAQLRANADRLSVLLGVPPQELGVLLGEPGRIPKPPPTVAVGIPADLLERRPDVRVAERAAAAQSARIGVAFSDLLPRVQLLGSVGLSAQEAAELMAGRAFAAQAGPQLEWPVLNYGRIISNVRLQDATFQELLARYVDTVLRAQQEVEDALAGYLRGLEATSRLEQSVGAANRAVELSLIQYREGAADYTRVLNSQQSKLREDDLLAQTRGQVASSVVALYAALGGGWTPRAAQDLIPAATRQAMRERTWYGDVLDQDQPARDAEEAAHGTEGGGWWRWRAWRPRWW